MEINVIGIDPSLRNTGICRVSYNQKTEKYSVDSAVVIVNPNKFKGLEATLNMITMIQHYFDQRKMDLEYSNCIIEFPQAVFGTQFSSGTMASIGSIAGSCVPIFGCENSVLISPATWKKKAKKEKSAEYTQRILGNWDTWKFDEQLKNESKAEHVLDAAGLALWWIEQNHVEKT